MAVDMGGAGAPRPASGTAGVVDVARAAPAGMVGTAGTNVGGTTIEITIAGDMITVDAHPVGGEANTQPTRVDSIGAALQMVLDVYERQELPDTTGDRAFESGFRGSRSDRIEPPARAPKPGPGSAPPITRMR